MTGLGEKLINIEYGAVWCISVKIIYKINMVYRFIKIIQRNSRVKFEERNILMKNE